LLSSVNAGYSQHIVESLSENLLLLTKVRSNKTWFKYVAE